jgi:DMSO/TMAO reductase YedYZ molybdopterin-dependent catalytic subunit
VDTLLDQVAHDAPYVLAFCDGGYTANLPVKDVTGGQAWVVFDYDGQRLKAEHGGPARLLIPHLYFWKNAKYDLRRPVGDCRRFRSRRNWRDRIPA